MGSGSGDVDDGFALVALLLSGQPVAAIGSVFGNTSEEQAFENNRALSQLCGFQGSCLRGAEASRFLVSTQESLRVLALGPLTNIAAALEMEPALARRMTELIVVGANAASRGRWPPLWPFEFNLVRDRQATRTVLCSEVPLTIVPLDVARRLWITRQDLREVGGPVGAYLQQHADRWFRRARLLKWRGSVPLWDLVAALYVLEPSLFRLREDRVRFHDRGWIQFGNGPRPVRRVEGFDREAVWRHFVRMVSDRSS